MRHFATKGKRKTISIFDSTYASVQVPTLTVTGVWLDSVMQWCKAFFLLRWTGTHNFFVTAEWTNFILHFQILLILPSALMETTAMALHFVESYLAGLWHSLLKSVLGSSLPLEAWAAQSSQNREVRSLRKVSIPDGGLPQLFFGADNL